MSEKKDNREPGCPSCAAIGKNCGGHWNSGRRVPIEREQAGRITLDVIDEDYDHDAFYRGRE